MRGHRFKPGAVRLGLRGAGRNDSAECTGRRGRAQVWVDGVVRSACRDAQSVQTQVGAIWEDAASVLLYAWHDVVRGACTG